MSGVFRLLLGVSTALLPGSAAAAGQPRNPAPRTADKPAAEPAAPVVPVDAVAEAYRLFTEGRIDRKSVV